MVSLPGIRLFPLAFLLGGLAACGFAPLGLWPLTLAGLAALTALVARAGTIRRAAAIGWWFGLGNFCVGLNWIATAFTYQAAMPAWLGWIAVVLLSLYLAVYPALATGAAWLLSPRSPGRIGGLALPLFLSAAWIANEYLRATVFTGFAWNPIAAIWAPLWPVAGAVATIGTYGLSGLTMLVAGLLWLAIGWLWRALAASPQRRGGRLFIIIAMLAAVVTGAGSALIGSGAPPPPGPGPLIRIVQPNINQNEKWDPNAEARNFARLVALTGQPGPRPRLILWPEVAVPWFLEEDPAARATLAALLGPRDLLLTGGEAIQYAPDGRVISATNSAFGVDARGRLLGRYDKAHLVPYGEYLPMRPILSRLGLSRLAPGDMDFRAGPGPHNIVLPGIGPVGVQICYEIVFSGQVVDERHRPRFVYNPSNDAWFGRWGPPQHLAQARLRAIEEGVPVVRATPTGISAVVDADGRLLAALPWRRPGVIELPLPPVKAPPLFARYGNLLPLLLATALALLGFATRQWRAKRI